jgi:hypothetical protein
MFSLGGYFPVLKYCHPGRSDHVERLLKRKEDGVHLVDLKLRGGKLQFKKQPESTFHNVPAICKRSNLLHLSLIRTLPELLSWKLIRDRLTRNCISER